MTREYPVVVTGGSGCLGQHLIKLLQTNADHVTEIRVLDAIPYENKLGHKEAKPVISMCGDVTNTDLLRRAFRGAKSVFHLASLVSVGSFPDNQAMERINVKGTRQVIDACIKEGVECLIYCSTVEVVLGFDDIVDGTEDNMKPPKTYFHEGYAKTKLQAESMVLQENDCQLDTGGVLKTAALRPYVFYGELDRHYVTQLMKVVKRTAGILIQTGNGKALHQHAYVGNNAWAFICAEKAVRTNPAAAGEAYFITDDTPVSDIYSQVIPFLAEKGIRPSSIRFPFWMMFVLLYLAECLLFLLSPVIKIDIGVSSSALRFANTTIKLSNVKARTLLNYTPLFSVEESFRNARHKEAKPVISMCGDVTNTDLLRRAFRGAKSVFHLASLVSVGSFPDNQAMERINVKGTRQVIDACIKEGVECLIYCSTVEVVLGFDDIVDGTEDNMKPPKTYFHEGYAKTKLQAESMVLQENDCQLDTGGVLKTAALRPYVFYGELDRHYVTQLMKVVKRTAGILIQTGNGKALHQHAYVGNNAWAFICAEKAVRTNPAAAGEAYFITDDTPVSDIYSQVIPFLAEKGIRPSSIRFPFWMMFVLLYLAECLLFLLSPVIKIDIGVSSSALRFANTTIKLSNVKARTLLNYTPLFSVEESFRNARAYYRDVQI